MSKFIIDGEIVSGSTSYASAIKCKDVNGNDSTVQAELDNVRDELNEMHESVDEQNKNFEKYIQYWIDNNYLPDPDKPIIFVYNQNGLAYYNENFETYVGTVNKTVDGEYIKNTFTTTNNHSFVGTKKAITFSANANKLILEYTSSHKDSVPYLGISTNKITSTEDFTERLALSKSASTLTTAEINLVGYRRGSYYISIAGALNGWVNVKSIRIE